MRKLMKTKKKRILSLILAGTMLLGMTGCGQSEKNVQTKGTEFTPSLDTNVKMTLCVAGVYGNFESLDAVAVAFQKYYPEIQVEYISISSGKDNDNSFKEDLENRLAAGMETDLIVHNWLNSEEEDQAFIFDALEDLNEANIDFSDIYPEAIRYGNFNDKFCALPIFMEAQGIAINTDIFEKAGVAIPQNYDELLASCEQLENAGYEDPVLTHKKTIGRCFIPYFYELMEKGDIDMKTAFDETLAKINDFVQSGYINPESKEMEDNYNAVIMRFLEGDIPMLTISSSNYSGIVKRQLKSETYMEHPFNYAFIPFPGTKEKNVAYMERLSMLAMGVNKNSTHLDYANEFMRFIARDEVMDIFAEKKGAPTPSKSGFDRFPYLRDANKLYFDHYSIAMEDAIKQALLKFEFDSADQEELYSDLKEYIERYHLEDSL